MPQLTSTPTELMNSRFELTVKENYFTKSPLFE